MNIKQININPREDMIYAEMEVNGITVTLKSFPKSSTPAICLKCITRADPLAWKREAEARSAKNKEGQSRSAARAAFMR